MALTNTAMTANRYGFYLKFFKYDSTKEDFKATATPDFEIDFAKSCVLDISSDGTWAKGGQGCKKLIKFDNPLEGTFKITTDASNKQTIALIAGEDPSAEDLKKIKWTNKQDKNTSYYVVEADTVIKDEDNTTYPEKVTLHKASANRSYSVTYSGEGDAQSVEITLELASDGNDDFVTVERDPEDETP